MTSRTSLACALCAGLLGACNEDSGIVGGLPTAKALRPGYSVIHRHDGDNGYHHTTVMVTDVAMRGDVIVVSAQSVRTDDYLGGGAFLQDPDFAGSVATGAISEALVYYVSLDAGATWTEHALQTANTDILDPFGAMAVVLLPDDRALAVVGLERSSGNDVIYPYGALGALDRDTGAWTRLGSLELHGAVREADGIVYTADSQAEVREGSPDGYGNYDWSALDAEGNRVASGTEPYAPGDCAVHDIVAVGETFGGLCQRAELTCFETFRAPTRPCERTTAPRPRRPRWPRRCTRRCRS